MPVVLEVTWDVRAFAAVLAGLSSPQFERAASAALNDTVKNAEVQGAKEVAPKLGLPSREVKAAMTIRRATPSHLEGALVVAGRAIPMIRFKPRDTKRTGVTVRMAGKVEQYRRAFIATMHSGYRGVFERIGMARGPLKQLYGPSVPGMFARRDVLGVVDRTMNENLLKNLRRQLDRQLRAKAGLVGQRG